MARTRRRGAYDPPRSRAASGFSNTVRTTKKSSGPKSKKGRQRKVKINISAKEAPYMAEVKRNKYLRGGYRENMDERRRLVDERINNMPGKSKGEKRSIRAEMKKQRHRRDVSRRASERRLKKVENQKDFGLFDLFAEPGEKRKPRAPRKARHIRFDDDGNIIGKLTEEHVSAIRTLPLNIEAACAPAAANAPRP